MIDYALDLIARIRAAWECPKCQKMHRRAQAAESEAAAVPRRFEGTLREITRRLGVSYRRTSLYSRRYHEARRKLVAAGVPDHNERGKFYRTGELLALIDRAIAQRSPEHELCTAAIKVRDEEIDHLRKALWAAKAPPNESEGGDG